MAMKLSFWIGVDRLNPEVAEETDPYRVKARVRKESEDGD